MAKEEELKKVELKVSVDCCDGCKKKVLKALSIQGVLKIEIHPNLPKVTVVGNVDKETLVKRLAKFGKVAEVIPPPDTNKGQQQQQQKQQRQQQQPQQQEQEESKKPNSDKRDGNCEKKSTKCTGEEEKVEKCPSTSNEITNNANSTTTTTISAMATTALPHITYTMNPAAVHEAVTQQHGVYPMNWYPGNPNLCAIPMASFVHGAYQTPVAQPYYTSGCCYYQPPPVGSLPPRLTEYFNDDNATGCHVM